MTSGNRAMPPNNSLISVGIDIGTTSCHLVFSRLSLVNEASANQIPRLVIGERAVLHESPIFFTPLAVDGSIDGAKVAKLMRDQYSLAGFRPDEINCGAVIITGETARLRNAEQVLNEISTLAGDFVAASAGPELESILAGRGSGALQHSKEFSKTICNIDIGGGTTNIAIFKNGALVETSCLRIGGRCFQFTKDGVITKISRAGKLIASSFKHFDAIEVDGRPTTENLRAIATYIANIIVDFVSSPDGRCIHNGLLIGNSLSQTVEVDEYWFSGGVAELMSTHIQDPFTFEDFGSFMANEISAAIAQKKIPTRIAKNPIRATVLGAGSYSVQLSGNTVSAIVENLPVKSVPLLRPFLNNENSSVEDLLLRLKKLTAQNNELLEKPIAIVLNFEETPRYASLRSWASVLANALIQCSFQRPYIVIVNTDSAMALGQLLRGQLNHNDVIVLDGIDLSTGDYIDIGKPINGGSTIPITVKSLVFSND